MNENSMTRDNYDDYRDMESNKKGFLKVIAILLLASVIMQGVMMYLQRRETEMIEQNAYLTSALIGMREDHLLLKYNAFPEQVGLADYKNAWIENPCSETAQAYSEALEALLNYLEEIIPSDFNINGVLEV